MLYFLPLINLLIYIIVAIIVCCLILVICYLFHRSKANSEKTMAYECGFKPFDWYYYPFDVQFYRIGIIFLLFDVEIMFIFPWAVNFYMITLMGHAFVFLFLCIIFLGFIYELRSGAIVWYYG